MQRMKKVLKRERGITLVALVITVAIILILTNVVVYNAVSNLRTAKLQNMQADIENLRDKVSNYYSEYGNIPADTSIEYTNTSHINSISSATDTGLFYVIDLAAMENVTLNYGKDYEKIRTGEATTQEQINQLTDLYIINGTSHNIFYVEGIEVDGERYYTDYSSNDVDNSFVDLRQYDGVEIPDGFYYVGGTKDTGLVISDVPGDDLDNSKGGNQFVWVPVENASDYVRNTSYDVISSSQTAYTDTGYLPEGIQPETDDATNNENAERSAVTSKGGFYISRYEAGKETSGETNKLVSKSGATVWNRIPQADCKTEAKKFINNDNVKSALCSGIQWDMTMAFVNGKQDGAGNTIDVRVNKDRGGSSPASSGQHSADRMCNIFDLEENYCEYVAEMSSYNTYRPFVTRGGISDSNGTHPASLRGIFNGYAYTYNSFRFVLYVMQY